MRPKEQKREKIQTSNQPKLVVSLVAPYRSLQCTSPWNQVAERPNAAAGWLPVATPTREAVAKVLERLFITYLFRVWNSFLVCSPPYGARVFCGDDPVEAGDLQVDRIKVAVAAGSDTSLGQEMLEDRFLNFGIVYFRFCQAGELRHGSACVVAVVCRVTRDVRLRLAALLGRSRLSKKKQWPDPGRRLELRITRVRRWLEACRFPWDADPRPLQEGGILGSSSLAIRERHSKEYGGLGVAGVRGKGEEDNEHV
jgi:hypothetical protein